MITNAPTYIAIVIEAGTIQDVVLEGWGADGPLPKIVVLDYDIGSAPGVSSDRNTIVVNGNPAPAWCHFEKSRRYEAAPSGSMRPSDVFAQTVQFERADKIEKLMLEVLDMQDRVEQFDKSHPDSNGQSLAAQVKAWLPVLTHYLSELEAL